MSELTPFGIELRKLRVEKRLRLLDVARHLAVTASYLSAIETGRKAIPDDLIPKLTLALGLRPQEIFNLSVAADRTRTEVNVASKNAEDRELIAALARRLDNAPEDLRETLRKLLESIAGETPFARKRRGIVVPPLSTKEIRNYAEAIRQWAIDRRRIDFPIMEFLEWGLVSIDPNFCFDVKSIAEMGSNEGLVHIGKNTLILREDVYEAVCLDDPRGRFTACHELAHYLMHRLIAFARAGDANDKIFVDSEWQADTFAGALLVSQTHAACFSSVEDMANKCKISFQAASVMWKKYSDDGIIRSSWNTPCLF